MAQTPVDKLVGVGIVPEQAKRIVEAVGESGLQIGTTSTTAMAGNRTPTTTIRGGVLQQPSAGIEDVPTLVAALIAAGVLSA